MGVFIPWVVENNVLSYVRSLLKEEYGVEYGVNSYSDLIFKFTDELFWSILRLVSVRRDDIISNSIVRRKEDAESFLYLMLRVAPKGRDMFKSMRDEFTKIVRDYLDHVLNGGDRPDMSPLESFVLNYVGISGYNMGNLGLIVLSSRDEVKATLDIDDDELDRSIVERIISGLGGVEFKFDSNTLYLDGKPLVSVPSLDRLVNALDNLPYDIRTKISNDIVKYIVKRFMIWMESNRPELTSKVFIDNRDNGFRLVFSSTLGFFSSLYGVDVPDDLRDVHTKISIRLFTRSDGVILDGEVNPLPHVSGIFKNASISKQVRFEDESSIDKLLELITRDVVNTILTYKDMTEVLEDKSKKYGLRISQEYSGSTSISYKKSLRGISISFDLSLSSNTPSVTVFTRITVKDGSDMYRAQSIVNSISKKILNEEPYIYINDDKIVVHWRFNITSGKELGSVIDSSMTIFSSINKKLKQKKFNTSRKDRAILASYLTTSLNPSNRGETLDLIVKESKRVLRKLGIPEIDRLISKSGPIGILTYSDKIIGYLLLGGVIKVESNHVEVMGERLHTILTSIGYDREDSVKVEREVSDSIVKSLLALSIDDITRKVNGRSLWDLLPRDLRRRYMERLTMSEIERIVTNPDYEQVFPIKEVVNKIIKQGSPSLKTYVFYKYLSSRIGLRGKAKLAKVGSEFVIDVGSYYVQIDRVKNNGFDYIVYRKDVGLGVVYTGRTILEALVKATKTYSEILNRYNTSRKRTENRLVRLTKPNTGDTVRGDTEEDVDLPSVNIS